MFLTHRPITWADFIQNAEYHLNRLCVTKRADCIPIYLGDDAPNPFAGALLSLPAFRLLSEDADERLYFFKQSFSGPNAETEQAKAGVTENWNEALQNAVGEQILSVRAELDVGYAKYMYFMGENGYRGVFAIYSHEADIARILEVAKRRKIVILSQDDEFLHRFIGADTRPEEEISAFGKIPDEYEFFSA